MGGGPGIRVHQFGGARPRRRPRENGQQEDDGGRYTTLLGALPILLFFFIPLLSSIFSGSSDSSASTPRMVFDNPLPPYTEGRQTPNWHVNYFVNPSDISSYSRSKLHQLDRSAENHLIRHLRYECDNELLHKQQLRDAAMGWFYQDPEKMAVADAYEMPSCDRLSSLGVSR